VGGDNLERLFHRDVEGLHFYEDAVRNTLCIMRCKRAAFGSDRVEQVSHKVLEEFDTKAPYDYLQLCYYQTKDYQRAASAAFTNLVYNPGAETMSENLEYYIEQAGADRKLLVNFEASVCDSEFLPYQALPQVLVPATAVRLLLPRRVRVLPQGDVGGGEGQDGGGRRAVPVGRGGVQVLVREAVRHGLVSGLYHIGGE
jgi:hypothetical protein